MTINDPYQREQFKKEIKAEIMDDLAHEIDLPQRDGSPDWRIVRDLIRRWVLCVTLQDKGISFVIQSTFTGIVVGILLLWDRIGDFLKMIFGTHPQ